VAKIGSFSVIQRTTSDAQKPREPDTFDFEGSEYRVITTTPSGLPLMQFAAAMESAEDDSLSMEALGAMYNMLRYCIEPADWAAFEKAAMRAGAGIDTLLPITMAVWQSVGSNPTEGPSDSPDGPSVTGLSSKDDSPSPTARPSRRTRSTPARSAPDVSGKVAANEWTAPTGRPDLETPLTPVEDLTKRRRRSA
jgi:hypothetical protein